MTDHDAEHDQRETYAKQAEGSMSRPLDMEVLAGHSAEIDGVTKGHDMSRHWRLVSNDGGLITGTWWVTREDRRGEQHVKPIDVVMWSEGRHSGLTLHSEDFTAFVRGGEVEPITVRSRHSHVEAEANSRLDEIAAVVLTVAATPEWPTDPVASSGGER